MQFACTQSSQDEHEEHAARLVVGERLGDTPDLVGLD